MANLIANLKLSLTYPAPGGGSVAVPAISVNCPFQASLAGFVDVPDATAQDVEIPVPFGPIGTGATFAMIINKTGQNLKCEINGAAAPSHDIAPEGVTLIAMPALPAARRLTALSFHTTAAQVGAGRVEYFVFGDPGP